MATGAPSRESLQAFVAAAALAVDLDIRPEWLDGVSANLEVSLRLAKLVDAFSLPDDAEPATVFEA